MSHGELAQGMVNSAEMIVGDVPYLDAITAYVDGNNDISRIITTYLKKHNAETVFVLTDIFGGSVNNQWMRYVNQIPKLYLITGVNLPMIIQLITEVRGKGPLDPDKIIRKVIQVSKEGCEYCNALKLNNRAEDF